MYEVGPLHDFGGYSGSLQSCANRGLVYYNNIFHIHMVYYNEYFNALYNIIIITPSHWISSLHTTVHHLHSLLSIPTYQLVFQSSAVSGFRLCLLACRSRKSNRYLRDLGRGLSLETDNITCKASSTNVWMDFCWFRNNDKSSSHATLNKM